MPKHAQNCGFVDFLPLMIFPVICESAPVSLAFSGTAEAGGNGPGDEFAIGSITLSENASNQKLPLNFVKNWLLHNQTVAIQT